MGKTLGFGVPLLQRLALDEAMVRDENGKLPLARAPRALVMVPTRELCVQVTRDLHQVGKFLGLAVTSVYGGRAYEPQITALHNGVDLVVGTPGRLLDLANGGHLVLGGIKVLVLDEADEMLDLGFLPDMERVLAMVPTVKQTMLFSATMPGPILTLARTFMSQPTHIRAELAAEGATHTLDQAVRLPGARAGQGGDAGPGAAGPRSRTDDGVHPHQAHRREGRRRADRARLRRRRRARRPRSGRARAGAAGVPVRQGRRAGGHRRGRPRHRRRRRHARHQLPVPGRGQDLHPPDRPHRPGRQDRHRGVLHRLGRRPALEADQRVARPGLRRPGGDLLHLQAPVRRPEHSRTGSAGGCRPRSGSGRAWAPRTSRTSARPAASDARRRSRAAVTRAAAVPRPTVRTAGRAAARRAARRQRRAARSRTRGGRSRRRRRHGRAVRRAPRSTRRIPRHGPHRRTRPPVVTGPVAAPAAAGPPTRPSRSSDAPAN